MPKAPDRNSSGASTNTRSSEKPVKVYFTDRGGRYVDARELLATRHVRDEIEKMVHLDQSGEQ